MARRSRLTALLCAFLALSFVLVPGGVQATHTAPVFTSFLHPAQIAGAHYPDQIQTAYDFQPLYDAHIDGTGQTVGLVEIDGFKPADIAAFDKSYDLPDPAIKETYIGGKHFQVGNVPETTTDIEWLHALAPGAAIHIYYLNNNESEKKGWQDMALAAEKALHAGIGILSISLGACQADKGTAPTQAAFKDLFHHNVSVFVSSGDDGDHPGPVHDCGSAIGIEYPGSDPYAVAVGGTALSLNPDNTIGQETAWQDSGGGSETLFDRRPFQHAPTMPLGTPRWDPDVAFLSTNYICRADGAWHVEEGTSLGAPAWAAIWALIRQQVMDAGKQLRPAGKLLYRAGNSTTYATDFHDITAGSNGTYHAGVGWDPVTGWGTPDVANLAATILAWSH